MKISPEIREHWTNFLQGQLSAREYEALSRQLDSDPDLALALAADARMHQSLLDHFAVQPTLTNVLASLPKGSYGQLPDTAFVDRCMRAVGQLAPVSVPIATNHESKVERVEASRESADSQSPPVFDLEGGVTFQESGSIPPTAIEPPPVCGRQISGMPDSRVGRNRPVIFFFAMACMLMLALGVGWYVGAAWNNDASRWAKAEPAGGAAVPEASWPPAENAIAGQHEGMAPNRALDPRTEIKASEDLAGGPGQPNPSLVADVERHPQGVGKREADDFPRVIRGGGEDEPNFIKDTEELPSGPRFTKLPIGQLVAGREAKWDKEPGAWIVPAEPDAEAGDPSGRVAQLIRGEAQLVLDNGLKVGMQAPAAFRIVSANKLDLIEGMFLIEPKDEVIPTNATVATDCFELQPQASARFFVSTSKEFGTGVELLSGEARITPTAGLGEPTSMSQAGCYVGHFFPIPGEAATKPGAAALGYRDGQFMGRLVAFDLPLLISSSEVFGSTLQILVKRMREAPAGFSEDWSQVVSRLEQLGKTNRKPPGLKHKVQVSGDLLPAFPDLFVNLGRGIPTPNGPVDMGQIQMFAGQMNVNGQLIDLNNLDKLRTVQQELTDELVRAQQDPRRGNRNRRNMVDPEAMALQLMLQQLQQIEMILKAAQGFQNNINGLPMDGEFQPIPREPMVAPFFSLLTPEGAKDRTAVIQGLQQALEQSLEDDAQRARRLQELREKLHQ